MYFSRAPHGKTLRKAFGKNTINRSDLFRPRKVGITTSLKKSLFGSKKNPEELDFVKNLGRRKERFRGLLSRFSALRDILKLYRKISEGRKGRFRGYLSRFLGPAIIRTRAYFLYYSPSVLLWRGTGRAACLLFHKQVRQVEVETLVPEHVRRCGLDMPFGVHFLSRNVFAGCRSQRLKAVLAFHARQQSDLILVFVMS